MVISMDIQRGTKESFSVIGKEGSTDDGKDFIQRLWEDANSHFNEVVEVAKKDDQGNLLGIWGAMSDVTYSYQPWEDNFTKGRYLAGVEVMDDAKAPEGWTKWTIPAYEYLIVRNEGNSTFPDAISYLREHKIPLVGAAHDFNCPETGQAYIFFPVQRL